MVSDSNELSREDQLRAELIYNCAQYVGWGLWFVAILVVAVIQGYTARYFPPMRGSDGWMGGTAILPMLLIPRFAASRVKRAGISRERVESRVVPKSFAQFGGEPFCVAHPQRGALGVVHVGVLRRDARADCLDSKKRTTSLSHLRCDVRVVLRGSGRQLALSDEQSACPSTGCCGRQGLFQWISPTSRDVAGSGGDRDSTSLRFPGQTDA